MALLHRRLRDLLDSFLQPELQDPLGLIVIMHDTLHYLGLQGVGAISVQIAQHLLQLFEHVRGAGWGRPAGAGQSVAQVGAECGGVPGKPVALELCAPCWPGPYAVSPKPTNQRGRHRSTAGLWVRSSR